LCGFFAEELKLSILSFSLVFYLTYSSSSVLSFSCQPKLDGPLRTSSEFSVNLHISLKEVAEYDHPISLLPVGYALNT
jgi:hypothetical protein